MIIKVRGAQLCAIIGMGLCVGCGSTGDNAYGDDADVENVDSVEEAISGLPLQQAYLAGFGRTPTGVEVSYWNAQPGFSATDMRRYLEDWLSSSNGRVDREQTITRAYQMVYRRNPGPTEMSYWSDYIRREFATYSDLILWLDNFGRDNRYPKTGTYSVQYWFIGGAYQTRNGPTYNVTAS